MPTSVPLRSDFTSTELRRLASRCADRDRARRLLSLAALVGGMDRQTLRDWVHRFSEEGPEA